VNAERYGFAPEWPAPPAVRAWVTVRGGEGAYGTLNLATHVGDDPARVAANRARLSAALALPAGPAWLEQVHGTRVLELGVEPFAPADGAVTGEPGVVCAVMTADCLPVLLTDRLGTRVGVAHAGWRGLLRGILPAAVAKLGVKPAQVVAWLGPAIGPRAFEVGPDVREPFVAASPAAERHFTPNPRGRWQADLYGLARDSLASAGVVDVHGGGFCTFAERERFFSHRREAPCGRMAALIWLHSAG
jgi:YfiH family protein